VIARDVWNALKRTLPSIPPEMPDAIESMESERRCQNDLGGVLERFRESRYDIQYMYRVESSRSGEVCQEVAVHHCNRLEQRSEVDTVHSQTLRPTPLIRLAMEDIHVNWGW
jgi:hypothetical protein